MSVRGSGDDSGWRQAASWCPRPWMNKLRCIWRIARSSGPADLRCTSSVTRVQVDVRMIASKVRWCQYRNRFPREVIMPDGPQAHWEAVYSHKGEQEVSWFQESPEPSLELIARAGATPASDIIDIGGGASRLVDALLSRGFKHLSVLDLSEAALAKARARLGESATKVRWIAADVTTWQIEA